MSNKIIDKKFLRKRCDTPYDLEVLVRFLEKFVNQPDWKRFVSEDIAQRIEKLNEQQKAKVLSN